VPQSSGFTFGDAHESSAETMIDHWTNRVVGSTYDAAGNQTFYTPWALSYDAENRMISATSSNNGNSWFSYDGNGKRIKKVTATPGTQTTFYVYDVSGRLAAEYSTQPIPAGTSYLFSDLLGTPRAITSDNGTILECPDYSPFGRLLQTSTRSLACHTTPSRAPQQFTGQIRDTETKLDYFGARYYSGAEGRFLSSDGLVAKKDWLLEPQRWNRYAYALNNPIKYVDPDGKDAIAAFFLGEQYRNVSTFEVIFSKETITEIQKAGEMFFAEHRRMTHGLSPVPTSKSEAGMAVIVPFGGKYVGRVGQKLLTVGSRAGQKLLTQGKPVAGLLRAGRTVLGKVGRYEKVADELGANKFKIPDDVWNKMTDKQRIAANFRFLDRMIARGDEVILADPVTDIQAVGGHFRKELDYLIDKGYRLSKDGTRMIR
jgi:RHS repeat-associated protein